MSQTADVVTASVPKSHANVALDHIIKFLSLKNDAALCRALQVAPPVISKIRNGKLGFAPSMIIRAHEITGLSIRSIKDLLGEQSLDRYAA
jgi:plasmid maintenance system antidote protein VapI